MNARATTEMLSVGTRPTFEIDGRESSSLNINLLELDASEDEDGMTRCELRLLNWGRRRQGSMPDFLYFDGEELELGKELRVKAGATDAEGTLFAGVITSIEGIYPELRPPEMVVRAEDRLQWMRMRQRTRAHEESTDAQIASSVAGDYSLASDTQAEGPSHTQLWQINQSDLGFLRERARAVDARLGLSGSQLIFRPRREPQSEEPIPLSRAASLLQFEVNADLAHQRTEVRVHGYSVADKDAIHESANQSEILGESEGTGSTGPEWLDRLGIEAPEDLHMEAPAKTEEARMLARAQMLRRARRFVCGRGITDGTPGMHVGSQVEFKDLGPWFSGRYHICTVRHTYDQDRGLRTYFTAERTELGESA